MMIDPPTDKLIKKAACRYALVCGLAKRGRQVDAQNPYLYAATDVKPISLTANESYECKVIITRDHQ